MLAAARLCGTLWRVNRYSVELSTAGISFWNPVAVGVTQLIAGDGCTHGQARSDFNISTPIVNTHALQLLQDIKEWLNLRHDFYGRARARFNLGYGVGDAGLRLAETTGGTKVAGIVSKPLRRSSQES